VVRAGEGRVGRARHGVEDVVHGAGLDVEGLERRGGALGARVRDEVVSAVGLDGEGLVRRVV
jgi:hypothetical protein